MEQINQPEQKSILEEIKEVIESSSEKIQEEMKRSGNRWLACMITRASILKNYLNIGQRTGQIDFEHHEEAIRKLQSLIDKVYGLQRKHDIKEDIPEELKDELILELGKVTDNL